MASESTLHEHLTLAGISATTLDAAKSAGLSLQTILGLIIQYGPGALAALEQLLAGLKPVTGTGTGTGTATGTVTAAK